MKHAAKLTTTVGAEAAHQDERLRARMQRLEQESQADLLRRMQALQRKFAMRSGRTNFGSSGSGA